MFCYRRGWFAVRHRHHWTSLHRWWWTHSNVSHRDSFSVDSVAAGWVCDCCGVCSRKWWLLHWSVYISRAGSETMFLPERYKKQLSSCVAWWWCYQMYLSIAQLQLHGQVFSILWWQVLMVGESPFQTRRLLRCEAHLAAFSLEIAWWQEVAAIRMRIEWPQPRRHWKQVIIFELC